MPVTIREVDSRADLDAARQLFQAYADSLGFDLCFQNFTQELAGLPAPYAPPAGAILLARVDGEPAGCVAFKQLAAGICEMKRFYVRPEHRGHRIGSQLMEQFLQAARAIGYTRIRLDTIPAMMTSALSMYRALGFQEIEPYCENPIPGALFLELRLT